MSDPTRLNVPLIAYMENKPCDVCDHVSDSLFTCMHYFTYQKWTKHWEPTPATIRRNQCLDLCFWLILGWYWLTRDGRWSFALCHDASTHKGKRKRAHNTFFFCWIPFCYSAVEAGHENIKCPVSDPHLKKDLHCIDSALLRSYPWYCHCNSNDTSSLSLLHVCKSFEQSMCNQQLVFLCKKRCILASKPSFMQ